MDQTKSRNGVVEATQQIIGVIFSHAHWGCLIPIFTVVILTIAYLAADIVMRLAG